MFDGIHDRLCRIKYGVFIYLSYIFGYIFDERTNNPSYHYLYAELYWFLSDWAKTNFLFKRFFQHAYELFSITDDKSIDSVLRSISFLYTSIYWLFVFGSFSYIFWLFKLFNFCFSNHFYDVGHYCKLASIRGTIRRRLA